VVLMELELELMELEQELEAALGVAEQELEPMQPVEAYNLPQLVARHSTLG
jgi:hypothetical protein